MAASAALSKDGGLPEFDIQKQCQKTQRATDELTGTKNPGALDLCLKSEQSAREKLAERWATTSALDKTSCIHPADWSPSYFEWLGCLDTRDTCERMRKGSPDRYACFEAVPHGELAIRWLNHRCRRMPTAIEIHVACMENVMTAPRLMAFGAVVFIGSVSASCAGPCSDDIDKMQARIDAKAARDGSCRADWSPSWRQYARSTDTAINRCCRGKTWRGADWNGCGCQRSHVASARRR